MKTVSMIFVPLLILTQNSWAEPTLYPPDVSAVSSVKNTTNSNILGDEVDAKTIWVMPPNTATAKVTGLHSKTANMGFCAEMGDLKDYSRDLSRQIKELNDRKLKKESEFIELRRRADKANEDAEKFATEKNMNDMLSLDSQIKSAESRLTELYDANEKCTENCDGIQAEITSTVQAKDEMMKQRNALMKQHAADYREYDRRSKAAAAAMKTYQGAKLVYAEILKDILDIKKTFLDQFSTFGKMGGAKAGFRYESTWNQNIDQLRRNNPSLRFEKVATKEAIVHPELAGVDNIDPTNAIIGVNLAEGLKEGVLKLPAYPENLSVDVSLSLIGACPMEHPEYFDMKDNDPSQMRYGMIISYAYDSVFKVKASAQYNMYKMYQKIVSSGSSGGLFSSSSWSSVQEREFFKDSFKVIWEDKENTLSQDYKDKRESEMRRNVMLRLATLALPQTAGAADIIAAAAPPTRGAVVVADELTKACPGNVYCQGAAIVFRVLDSIFGSSSSSSSYTNIKDLEVKESFESSSKITKPWITSYL